MSKPRHHHLRDRRLKLGVSQFLIGCLAGWPPAGAQAKVSAIERNTELWPTSEKIRRVRSALVYLESEPRRRREWQRRDAAEAAKVERAIAGDALDPAAEQIVVDRLVDLLFDGRADEYDALAARVAPGIAERAGERYLEEATPQIPPAPGEQP